MHYRHGVWVVITVAAVLAWILADTRSRDRCVQASHTGVRLGSREGDAIGGASIG